MVKKLGKRFDSTLKTKKQVEEKKDVGHLILILKVNEK
jgi:hypothetical protein